MSSIAAPAVQRQWVFSDVASASAWQLTAEAGAVSAIQPERGLTLVSTMVTDKGQTRCPVASAEVLLTDPRVMDGSLAELAVELEVTRWDLGLGRFDTDVPRIELTLKGLRYRMGVEGFKRMPGTVRFEWTAATGLRSRYDGVPHARQAEVMKDSGHPRLRLWVDGCSQGMSQALAVRQVVVSGR